MMWEAAARKIQECGGRVVMDRKFDKLRLDPVEFFAFECLTGRIKRKPAQENLIGLAKGLHPGTRIDLQAVEILDRFQRSGKPRGRPTS